MTKVILDEATQTEILSALRAIQLLVANTVNQSQIGVHLHTIWSNIVVHTPLKLHS
jgi:hypothetical protein